MEAKVGFHVGIGPCSGGPQGADGVAELTHVFRRAVLRRQLCGMFLNRPAQLENLRG